MNPKLLSTLAAVTLALGAGCASSGGGGGGGSKDAEADDFICGLLAGACAVAKLFSSGSPAESPRPASGTATKFTSWAEAQAGRQYQTDAVETIVRYAGTPTVHSLTFGSFGAGFIDWFPGPASSPMNVFAAHGPAPLTALGQPGIELSRWDVGDAFGLPNGYQESPFTTLGARSTILTANPATLGWSYQSFGVWDAYEQNSGSLYSRSLGAGTPASAVPSSGAASFTGKLAGFHLSPAGQGSIAAADLTVNADFSSRFLTFTSTGTRVTRDNATPTAAPNLDLRGTLAYSPATNRFTGTLTNAGGTMSGSSTGRFYGPAAQELGGVFAVTSPAGIETFTGAYGAKR